MRGERLGLDRHDPAPKRAEPADGPRDRTADKRNRRDSSGSYAAGVEGRPEGVRRSAGGVYGPGAGCAQAVVSGRRRNGASPPAGRCRERGSLSPRSCGDSLLSRPESFRSHRPLRPGNRDHAPGFELGPNPEKASTTTTSVLRRSAFRCQRKTAGFGPSGPKC